MLRWPLLHFALIGSALFALDRLRTVPDTPIEAAPIELSAERVEALRAAWVRDSGRLPTEAELRASIRHYLDDEILLREALARGLDRSDPVVRERLLRNMRFLFPQRRASDDALLHEAAALGMNRSDPVVRRRLVQAMERRLVRAVPVDPQALAAYRERHPARYRAPARLSFRHVFFSDDGARADARAELEALRARLLRGEVDAARSGDAFLLGAEFRAWSAAQVGARFGRDFADALVQAPEQTWTGPLRSAFGWHLVQVTARVAEGGDPPPQQQAQLLRAWQDEARAQQLREALQRLRARYPVVGLPAADAGGA
ncbi:peptidylprolyl isomerase [Fontimonas sp. SYSU GA230001]|uniref:peptidylprolyl isomerase n=1 Tax=Fontimonas sp. SYSU GA230001 TaxID=3142450 RepID=UPI0032B61051